MKRKLLTSIFLVTVLSAFARAEETTGTGQLSSQDMNFARDATEGGTTEVQLGRMAMENSTNQMVRQFGEEMVRDHQKASDELSQILDKKGVAIPMSEMIDTNMVNRLQGLKGEDFDRAYMKHMVKDHKTDVAAFKKEVADGDDSELKTWAAQTLPVLQEHLKMAEKTESAISQ